MQIDDSLEVSTEKWNPVTFAMCAGNLTLLKHLLGKSSCNLRDLIKVPGMDSTSEMTKLFPFYVALYRNSVDMFDYFWNEIGGSLWSKENFEDLFKLLVKKEADKFLPVLFRSKTTLAIFYSLS